MTLRELYTAIGGDYEGVLGRMMNRESMVEKFVLKFLQDASYDKLMESMEAENYEEAFRAAHTIKGVGQNLGFTRLYQSAGALSEALRGGCRPQDQALLERVEEDYRQTAGAIRAFQEASGT